MKKLVSTLDMSREEWLSWRRKGIGGSDAAALVGLSRWATPFSVYADKMGLSEDKPDTEAMRQGRDLEEYVARRFADDTGKRVRRCNAILVHPQYDFLLANVDRMVDGENAGLECKTMNPRSPAAAQLEDGSVPEQYYCQCQHYMMVTGCERWYLAILVLGTGFYWFDIPRHEDDISALQAAEVAFWRGYVETGVMPAPDGSDACTHTLKGMYPTATPGTEIALTDSLPLDTLAQIKAQIKMLEEAKAKIENTVLLAMEDAEIGRARGWRVSLKNCVSTRIDLDALRTDHPEIVEQYKKITTYRRLTVKEEET